MPTDRKAEIKARLREISLEVDREVVMNPYAEFARMQRFGAMLEERRALRAELAALDSAKEHADA